MTLVKKSLLLSLKSFRLTNKTPALYLRTTQANSIEKSFIKNNQAATAQAAASSKSGVMPPPQLDGQSKEYSPKIKSLVDEIAKLNLIEVSDLNELLRKTLNIKDAPMSFAPAGSFGSAAPTPAAKEEEQDEQPKATKSSFKLKIVKYDEAKKVALIKEIKALGENMNLVQAKKFIESVPQVFKDNIGKDDAEKIKAQLEKQGAVCEIE